MFNSKYVRLLFGMIFLFSVFLFQGSQSEGCLKCENEASSTNNLTILITNASGTSLRTLIISDKFSKEQFLYDGESWLNYVQPGTYNISAFHAGDYVFNTGRIVDGSAPDFVLIITREMLDD